MLRPLLKLKNKDSFEKTKTVLKIQDTEGFVVKSKKKLRVRTLN